MFKLEGLEQVTKNLDDAAKALEQMDGEIGTVNFDPEDPASIDRAIHLVNQMIDEEVRGYESNPIISGLIDEMKSSYREAILEKAAAARLERSNEGE